MTAPLVAAHPAAAAVVWVVPPVVAGAAVVAEPPVVLGAEVAVAAVVAADPLDGADVETAVVGAAVVSAAFFASEPHAATASRELAASSTVTLRVRRFLICIPLD